MEKLCDLPGVFMEKTWFILLPEWTIWRFYGDIVESDTSYGDFMGEVA